LAFAWKLVGDINHSYILGLFLCVFTFRADAIIYLAILLGYYEFVKRNYQNKDFEKQIWALSVTVLILHEWSGRLRGLSNLMEPYVPGHWFKNSQHLIHWGSLFNMSILKLISFGVDNHRTFFKKDHLETHK
jgi:transcriptional regulator with PAS, ATPase and Fis domain